MPPFVKTVEDLYCAMYSLMHKFFLVGMYLSAQSQGVLSQHTGSISVKQM